MAANPALPRFLPAHAPDREPGPPPTVAEGIAIFDFDGTVTRGDTLLPFLRHVAGTRRFVARFVLLLPLLAAMALHLVARDTAKRLLLRLFLGGMRRAQLEASAASFVRDVLPRLVRPQALEEVARHRRLGHRCVLATASPDLYVRDWARAAGFDDVIATRLRFDERDRADGGWIEGNCRGAEKLRRLEAAYGDLRALRATGYGDSADDRPFLERCSEARFRPFQAGRGFVAFRDLVRLMRPHQWVKNGFVLAGLLFGHAWTVPALVWGATLAVAAFCLVSSAVYIVNDYADRERDRNHPRKRDRPLASGRVAPRTALLLAALLAASGAALANAASPVVLLVVGAYATMNLGYSFALKDVVILDVFIIAAGFILRILAGTAGIGIVPSQWLVVCSLFLTLFLGFTKRRSELLAVGADPGGHRRALQQYNPELLDKVIAVSAGAALMSYSLYTMSPATVRLHGTENLVYTIPFVAYGLFRYLYLLHACHAGADTTREIARDAHLLVTVGAWTAVTTFLIA